jgi:hypothetical protein
MKPVVPKIRVGDVLLGTKNLRSYLRTCSLIRYFQVLDRRSFGPKIEAGSLLYTPHKQDRFVVMANNHGKFAVWSPNKNVVLLFINPQAEYGSLEYMNPEIFAQWFLRSSGKSPDVRSWPLHAHYIWGSLHMNAWKNRHTPLKFNVRGAEAEEAPFVNHKSISPGSVERQTISEAVRESVMHGVFRNLPDSKKRTPHLFGGGGYGPNLREVAQLRSKLETLMRNPRLVSKAKQEKDVDFSFLMNVQKNTL